MFCAGHLGANEVVESFPVGRRLAFDPAKGRLWVVCRRCARWNLTPLEERWEAFEECEKLFRDTRLRKSTDQVGLARLGEGLELVRIGKPLRPECAAWRYGDQFGRRRKRALIHTGAALAFAGGLWTLPLIPVTTAWLGYQIALDLPVRVRLRVSDGSVLKLHGGQVPTVRFFRDDQEGGWATSVARFSKVRIFRGADAARAARILLPAANRRLGSPAHIAGAVSALQLADSPSEYLNRVMTALPTSMDRPQTAFTDMPSAQRLAIEMALHHERAFRTSPSRAIEPDVPHPTTRQQKSIHAASAVARESHAPDARAECILERWLQPLASNAAPRQHKRRIA
jgi:hypothetical protein